jgi:VWFA-related protein
MKKIISLLFASTLLLGAQAPAQTPAAQQEPVDSHTVIRSETRLVLVDSVVTDKKGNYIHGLSQKDFKVWEDNKEQSISTFSFESGPNGPDNSRKHYLVLFFDNSTVGLSQQVYARDAATKFIDKNAGPNRLMSIVEFGGTLRVSQNFTDDADRLKQVVKGVKFASVGAASGGGAGGGAGGGRGFTNFSTRGVLGALRDMARGLADVPGRKTLIFLSAGFPMTPEVLTEVTATIDACNRSNVAIYPIDVRGLVAPSIGGFVGSLAGPASLAQRAMLNTAALLSPLAFAQGRGGSSGGGGGASSGGTASGGSNSGGGKAPGTGTSAGSSGSVGSRPVTSPTTGTTNNGGRTNSSTSGGGGANPNLNQINQMNQMNQMNRLNRMNSILPPIDNSITGNQQVLYALANGTGGFVIVNTNDLLGGLEKIGREQNEYYILGYTPSKEAEPGSCHTLRVKVDKGGAGVRARSGYCEAKSLNILSGTPAERELEARISGNVQSNVTATMQAPYFYISPNTARVDVALDIPAGSIPLVKEKGKFQGLMNVVGIAYLPDGTVGARFSDSVKISFDEKKDADAFEAKPYHYVKQFESAPGKFTLKVVFSASATQFGKLEAPLNVDPWEASQFALSGLALSKEVHPATEMVSGLDKDLLENRVPLVVNGVQVIPTGTNHFSKSDKGYIYAEIYEPALALPDTKEPPALGVDLRLLDGKTGAVIKDFGLSRLNHNGQLGNPAVPIALVLNVKEMEVGSYQIAITAVDAANHQVTRVMPIQIEN